MIVGDGADRGEASNPLLPDSGLHRCARAATELATAYASLDVFVHPGEHETFCQAVQEAMARGVPVVAPDAGGPRDLVAPLPHRLLLPVDEFEAKLAAPSTTWSRDRPRYSVAARRRVLHRTWPAICDELLGHYEAVQGLGGATAA